MKTKRKSGVSYLRNHRLAWGLSEKELSTLMGLKDASQVSRIEHSKRAPRTEVALACQVIFGIPPAAMFPHVFAQVEDRVMWKLSQLHSALEKTTSLSGLRKRELCELALERATGSPALVEV